MRTRKRKKPKNEETEEKIGTWIEWSSAGRGKEDEDHRTYILEERP
jgi:hypothetical protein